MDDIRGMVDRLPELSEDELGELESSIIQAFENVEGQEISRESVAEMTFLADSVEGVRAEMGRREAEKAELAQEAAQAATRIQSASTEEGAIEASTEDAPTGDPTEPPETFATTEAVETAETTTPAAELAATTEPAAELAATTEPVTKPAAKPATEPAAELAVTAEPVTEPAAELNAKKETPEEEEIPEEEVPEEDEEYSAKAAAVVAPDEDLLEEEVPIDEVIPMVDEVPLEEAPLAPVVEDIIEGIDSGVETIEGTEPLIEALPVEILPGEEAPIADVLPPEEEEEEPVFANNEEETATSTEAQMSNATVEPTFSAPADRLPVARPNPAPITLVAGGDIPGISAGSPLADRRALSEAMSMRLHSLRRASGGSGEQVVVASLLAEFPENRTLRGNEVDSNSEKIKSVIDPQIIVASGGWCAPLPVNYDLFDIGGSTDTPVRDSLPVFNADRGGVRYVKSPVFGDYDGAFGIWTNEDDIASTNPPTDGQKVKPCLHVGCAAEEEVYLEAVTMCLCFGNMQTRAFPELIARHNDLALVAAARWTETYLLDKIKAMSTIVVVPAVLGTARDVLISIERAASAYRYQYRLDPELPLVFMAPQWLHSMIRSDLTAQLPGDGLETTFNLANATINSFFTHRNINPVWTLETATNVPTPTVLDYPDSVEWSLFAEGTFTLLDGGTLDIGIVRDMALVSTNDYCMFTEQFLNVANTGLGALWVSETLNVNGASAGTLDPSAIDY
jgi:hypothetical protein